MIRFDCECLSHSFYPIENNCIRIVCSVSVTLGDYDLRTDPDCEEDVCAEPIQMIKIKKVIISTKYKTENSMNDIAVILLEKEATLNGIFYLNYSQLDCWIGYNLYISGWVNVICLPTGHEQIGCGVAEVGMLNNYTIEFHIL